IMLDLPALLRLSVSLDLAVVSATTRFRPLVKAIPLKRGSSALKRRSMCTPCHEEVLVQVYGAHAVEHVQGQNEPPERYGRGVVVLQAPCLQPRPRLAHGPRLIELEEHLGADGEQAAIGRDALGGSDHAGSPFSGRHPAGGASKMSQRSKKCASTTFAVLPTLGRCRALPNMYICSCQSTSSASSHSEWTCS